MPQIGSFVAELGGAALDLLDPQPGERILDVGCGEGTLTVKIIERGATVLGVDNSPEMIAAARAKGVDACLLAGRGHAVLRRVRRGLLQCDAALGAPEGAGGTCDLSSAEARRRASPARWAAKGNLSKLREALDEELIIRGYVPPVEASNWYASPEDFAGCL